jgi:hypothetical protein
MENVINVNDVIKKLQSVPAKQRELPFIVRAGEVNEGVAHMFLGVANGNKINFPELGEEPNCVVMKITDSKGSQPAG